MLLLMGSKKMGDWFDEKDAIDFMKKLRVTECKDKILLHSSSISQMIFTLFCLSTFLNDF